MSCAYIFSKRRIARYVSVSSKMYVMPVRAQYATEAKSSGIQFVIHLYPSTYGNFYDVVCMKPMCNEYDGDYSTCAYLAPCFNQLSSHSQQFLMTGRCAPKLFHPSVPSLSLIQGAVLSCVPTATGAAVLVRARCDALTMCTWR